jgi:cation diffusion facilitator family transporter
MTTNINTHEHPSTHMDDGMRLIDPTNCEEFMTYLDERRQDGKHGHDHGHDHSHAPKVSWRLITMIILNGLVFIAELVTGYVTQSLSLQSDAWHMLSDQASLVIGLIAHRMAKKPPTPTMTFGFARTEVLGGLVNATFLLAVCMMIAFDAIGRFIDPPTIQYPLLFLVVGGIGLITNVIGIFMFCDHDHSDNIKGVFLHVLSDFFGSVGVIATALLYYFSSWELKKFADPVFSLLIVVMLVRSSVQLFKKTAMTVAERCPDSIDSIETADALMKIEGVVAVHELHVWELARDILLAIIHIVVDNRERHQIILGQVHNLMIGRGVYSSTVQIEYVDEFPQEIDHLGHCFFASSFGNEKRAFLTPAVYRHVIGCPHLNIDDNNNDHEHDHDHDHDHEHEHDDSHSRNHNHNHNHNHTHGHAVRNHANQDASSSGGEVPGRDEEDDPSIQA